MATSHQLPHHVQMIVEFLIAIWDVILIVVLAIRDSCVAFFTNFAPIGLIKEKDITGKTILLTGAAGGLGREMAVQLARKGCRLILWDRDEKGLMETEKRCGGEVKWYTVDMMKREDIAQTADTMRKEIGPVHILINNAGVGIGGKILEVEESAIRTTMEVNCMSHFWMAREFLPQMILNEDGQIVTVASFGGLFMSAQDMVPYCTSKFAAVAIQQGLENELACMDKEFIKFTTICPLYFQTQLLDDLTTQPGLPVMTADYVAEWAINAILTEQSLSIIPRQKWIPYAFRGLISRATFKRIIITKFKNSR